MTVFTVKMIPEIVQPFWAAMQRGEFITDAAVNLLPGRAGSLDNSAQLLGGLTPRHVIAGSRSIDDVIRTVDVPSHD